MWLDSGPTIVNHVPLCPGYLVKQFKKMGFTSKKCPPHRIKLKARKLYTYSRNNLDCKNNVLGVGVYDPEMVLYVHIRENIC